MASFESIGIISTIKYLQDSVLVFIDEFKRGYTKSDGVVVDDRYVTYKTIWKPYFKKYINEHFNNGMLVQVKGEMLPYEVEQGKMVDGYSIIGQCINLASFPRRGIRLERRALKESQESVEETPDLDAFRSPDF